MKLNLTENQIEMLRKGYRRAQELPQGFDMRDWARKSQDAPCGTVCCYAGELLIANGAQTPATLVNLMDEDSSAVEQGAYDLLGIEFRATHSSWPPLESLFYVADWPKDLKEAYYEEIETPQEKADLLAEVVERFIAADGDTSNW